MRPCCISMALSHPVCMMLLAYACCRPVYLYDVVSGSTQHCSLWSPLSQQLQLCVCTGVVTSTVTLHHLDIYSAVIRQPVRHAGGLLAHVTATETGTVLCLKIYAHLQLVQMSWKCSGLRQPRTLIVLTCATQCPCPAVQLAACMATH